MLTRAERVVAASAAVVALLGLTSAGAVENERVTPVRDTAAVATPSPQRSAPAEAAPVVPEPAPVRTTTPPPPPPPPAGPLPAPPEPPQAGCPVPRRPGGFGPPKPLPPPAVADDQLPAPLAPGPKATDLSAVQDRSVWVTNWPTTDLDIPGLVERARAAGLRSIWVRTGGSRQGYYGDTFLPRLVPAAHAAGLQVVAWDFPFLSDPVADAQRARAALDAGVDAIAPDVETEYEGTYATPRRVQLYLSLVRSYAGTRPIAATVPRPTERRLATFPYSAFPAYADLFVPMVYWSCHEPGTLVAESLHHLGAMLPVHPVGQGYDMGEEGGRPGLPTFAETWRFLDAAKRGGAVGASLWTIERLGPQQWEALRLYPWAQVTP
ncbi:MAG TPA: hypothetical protein VNU26_13620 [Mycobacteriales bacterium]|nr:hypothetical protein [Mycobacteriales bacterium]